LVLGSVFLVVTGGEALYADMGHFGRGPITAAWFFAAFPALLINYLGQGAMLIEDPEKISSPFFEMGPGWSVWPLTVLATMATVIASQALITGAFSLTVQAIRLEYLPRMRIIQTSEHSFGQVYVPLVNWGLMVSENREFLSIAPWAALAPAMAMASLVVGVNLLTDGVREAAQLPISQEAS